MSTQQKINFFKYLILGLLVSIEAAARTEGRFTGLQYIINIVTESYDGSVEDTPGLIYKTMNVPPQNSFLGRGKALKTLTQDLSFVCNLKSNGQYHCSFIIFRNQNSTVGVSGAAIKYTGDQAMALYQQFTPYDDSGNILIEDDSKKFKLISTPDLFEMGYQD